MEALAFLTKTNATIEPLYVMHGDEAFLKRHALLALRARALGPDADDSLVSVHPGDKAQFAAVWDELETAPFFAPKRIVVVENADTFVTRFRALLEKKLDKKNSQLPPTGVLVLDVKTWPANTRLAKMVDNAATLLCKAPDSFRVAGWCAEWAKTRYDKQFSSTAAQLLVDLAGTEMGLLDQEMQKLAVYVGAKATIEPADVDQLVGRSRDENVWKILDALAAGNPGESFRVMQRLFEMGEEPMRVLGALGSQLRKLAQAGRLATQGVSLAAALERVGVPPYGRAGTEKQLRRLGRQRAARLYDWLLELTMGLRGGSPLPGPMQFERLVVRLAQA